ncbi:MAG: class I SAM-dependent methyltransferase [Bacteroidota bacterium]
MDVLGKALLDFWAGDYTEDIVTISSLEDTDTMSLTYLFRNYDQMPSIEQQALKACKGNVLDVGCGAGSHALYLQQQGFEVVGLDQSPGAIAVCQARGLGHTLCCDLRSHTAAQYDTLLLLMNGIGLAGTLAQLPYFLAHLKTLMKPNAQILVDSSDLIYCFQDEEDGRYWMPTDVAYYGEVRFQMEYKAQKGPIFDWLYLDYLTLKQQAEQQGLQCVQLVEGEHYDYLAKLQLQ